MGTNEKKDNQPPSLFDNLDMFAPEKVEEVEEVKNVEEVMMRFWLI